MRITVIAAALCMAIVGLSIADDVKASIKQLTDIPAQPLAPALRGLAKERNFQIVYVSEEIGDRQTSGAIGDYTRDEALEQLLKGTGLTYKYLDDNTITIVSSPSGSVQIPRQTREPSGQANTQSQDETKSKEARSSSFGSRFRLARGDQGGATQSSSVGQRDGAQAALKDAAPIQEIIVSAQKREERLQDVPIPVSVVNVDNLVNTNMLSLKDFYSSVPGLNWAPGTFHDSPQISIRGITSGGGFTNPTVGITVDDVPFGSSTGGSGGYTPDVDPSDLARIEVLRGPQGTLYGASSMGGLIKYVTVEPSTSGLSGQIRAGTSYVNHGNVGYNIGGAVNVPLSETLAIRASGFARQEPGYVDNPQYGLTDVNESHHYGGHLAALWRPDDNFSLKLSALIQSSSTDGSPLVAPTLGDLQQGFLGNTGQFSTHYQAFSATLKAKLAGVDIASISGYNRDTFSDSYDLGALYGGVNQSRFGVRGSPLLNAGHNDKFSQEIRLSSSMGRLLDWLVGGMYTHEYYANVQQILAENPSTQEVVGRDQIAGGPGAYQEFAGFADLTVHATDQLDVQVGGRRSEIGQWTPDGTFHTGYTGPTTFSGRSSAPHEHFTTYLFTPSYKFTPDVMAYTRFASGYRPGGGTTPQPADLCVVDGFPCQFNPDTTRNYEIGTKMELFDHVLSLDTSFYYVDWSDLQLQLVQPVTGAGYTTNAGRARSDGIEFSLAVRPVAGLTLSLWVDWDDAVLTEVPSNSKALERSGDRLPFSSRYSGTFSLNQDFALVGEWQGFGGASVNYVGDREGLFSTPSSPQRQHYPAYWRLDLRSGVRHDPWEITLYANNITDSRALVGGGLQTYTPMAFNIIQPRSVGLTVSRKF